MEFIRRVYGLFLLLFPEDYREEYGDELQAVFHLSIQDAVQKGKTEAVRFLVRELVCFPKAVVYEHLRARMKMNEKFQSRLNFAPSTGREVFAALYPFVVIGLILPLINMLVRSGLLLLPSQLVTAVFLILLGLIGLLLISGFALGLPRWSLPYIGFGAALLSVYLFSFLIGGLFYVLFSDLFDRASLFGEIFLDGVFWFGLLIGMALLVLGSTISPKFQRFRKDWTLPAFMLYGAVPFVIWLSFDEYVGKEPYQLLAFLVLALGCWFYLRSTDPQKRFWALFAALTMSLFITAGSKATLIPSQDWPITLNTGLVISEVKHTLIMWGWLALIMLLPLLLKGLSDAEESSQAAA